MRSLILLAALVGCARRAPPPRIAAPAPRPTPVVAAPAPANLVCDSFHAVNPSVKCTPEMTDAGPHHLHSARVVLDQQLLRCVINDAAASIVCTDLIVIQRQPMPEAAKTEKPKTKKAHR